MTTFPRSPRIRKGALVSMRPTNPRAGVIVFQYNPEAMTRTLTAAPSGGAGSAAGGAAARIGSPPEETIKMEVAIDASDQLEKAEATATQVGIYPQLSALELLLYPQSAAQIANEALLRLGFLEIVPPEAPLTVLVWGEHRVLPVRLNEFSIVEELYDPDLRPIHAKVSLGFRVLNYADLGLNSVGGGLFMAHQILKEGLAARIGAGDGAAPLGALGG